MRRTTQSIIVCLMAIVATASAAEDRSKFSYGNGPKVTTAYVPSKSKFCEDCVRCPTVYAKDDKLREACVLKYCGKCPNHVIIGAEESVDVIINGNDILALTENDMVVNGDTTMHGTLEVDGFATFHDSMLIEKDLEVLGTSDLTGNVHMYSDLQVDGSTTINGNLTVLGHSDISELHVLGDAFMDGHTEISDAHVLGPLEVDGVATFESPVTFQDTVTFVKPFTTKDLTVDGQFTLDGVGNEIGGDFLTWTDYNGLGVVCSNIINANTISAKQLGTSQTSSQVVFVICSEVGGVWKWRALGGALLNP